MTAKEVVASYLQALSTSNIPKAFSYFSTEAKWHQPGANQFSGIKNGTGKMLSDMMEVTKGSFVLKPNGNLMVNGSFVIMPVHFSGTNDDRNIDMTGIDLFEISEEKIVGVWLFSDDQEVEDWFWG
jgi:predicted SnoaL-like aldol condensation-catalyzing enzyme